MATLIATLQPDYQLKQPTELVQYKRPQDVYQALLKAIGQLQQLYQTAHLPMLSFKVVKQHDAEVTPDAVLNLAKLVVAETHHLVSLMGRVQTIKAHYYGYKTLSQAYGQVNLLSMQLDQLKQLVVQHPNWIRQ